MSIARKAVRGVAGDGVSRLRGMTVVGNMQINETTGKLTWTPATAGSYEIIVIASDGSLSETQTFTLTVLKNAPPVITSAPVQIVDANSGYLYHVVAADPNAGSTLDITSSPRDENPPATQQERFFDLLFSDSDGRHAVAVHETLLLPTSASGKADNEIEPGALSNGLLQALSFDQELTPQDAIESARL